MAVRNWSVNIDLTPHHVRLEHGLSSGKRRIWVDGELVHDSRILFDWGSRHWVNVGGVEYELLIITDGFRYRYFLLQDHEPISSEEELKRGRDTEDLLRSPFLRDMVLMQAVGKALALPYWPSRDSAWARCHRLVGFRSGYLVLFTYGVIPGTTATAWLVIVRHGEPLAHRSHEDLAKDPRIKRLLGKLNVKKSLESSARHVAILLPKKRKETPEALTAKFAEFLSIVSEHARPFPTGRCESPECKQPAAADLRLAFVDGFPWLLCEPCIAEIPQHHKQARRLYHRAPVNLLPGFIVAVGIALLGAVSWAAFALLLNSMAAAIPLMVLVWMLRAMDNVGTRVSVRSLLMATALTFASAALGMYLAEFLYNLRVGYPLSPETLFESYRDLAANPAMLRVSLFFTLLGAGFGLYSAWSQNRDALKSAFNSDVEVMPAGSFTS